ncbi:MAG: cofactor-independent phosphoglycerate mutase [Pirellulales bacterium]|nr:cofactor-independent phosphoglycerate mutase [Pirellulales bacterium]
MKYVIVIPDGAADEPQETLNGKTPLAAASTPALDAIAQSGIVGRANYVPSHLPAGSAVANMSLLGYDPNAAFTGRAPIEAAAQGIELNDGDWAVRCNLVTIENQIMHDFTADHISTQEATGLLNTLAKTIDNENIEWVPGVSYRNLLICRDGQEQWPFNADTRTIPPHDLTDQPVVDHYPRGPGSDCLNQWMRDSVEIFATHPINVSRVREGNRPATNIWLWGQGRRPQLDSFATKYGVKGTMITAVDLLRGLANLIGWENITVPGATGYTDTDYGAKGRAAVKALETHDLVCVHIEAPDEASHEGSLQKKIEAIEQIDQKIVAPLNKALNGSDNFRILVCPDHPTPVRTKTHSHGWIPFVLAGGGVPVDGSQTYDEATAESSTHHYPDGHLLMSYFIG